MNEAGIWSVIFGGFLETLYMTLAGTLFSYLIGLPLGIVLWLTGKNGLKQNKGIYLVFDVLINILRSVPFLILLVLIIPITRFITGTMIGTEATIVPLVFAGAPFVARLIESSFAQVDKGVLEAATSMGAKPWQITFKVLLPEAGPSLLTGAAIAVTSILGYSAMAGFVGGGGLGDIAIRYGFHRYKNDVMLVSVSILVIIVQILQYLGMRIAKRADKKV